jgi:hypothetical protein
MRETTLKRVSVTREDGIEETRHGLRGLGNKLMIRPNFMTLIAKVKFKV